MSSERAPHRLLAFLRLPRAALVPRSLRGRLLLALLVLTALVLLTVDVVVYSALRCYALDRADTTLRAVCSRIVQQARNGQPLRRGLVTSARMQGSSAFFIEVRRPDGTVEPLVSQLRNPDDPPPALPDRQDELPVDPATLPARQAGGPNYRVLTSALPRQGGPLAPDGGTLVVAMPLTEADATLRRLRFTETAATAGCLALLAIAGLLLVRRELRPLELMAGDADTIAAGHTAHRVRPAHRDSEVGRLGLALNIMLAEQDATQRRLRQFIADASHELRTPLSAVLGYADLHEQGALEDAAQRKKAMERITDEALRMQRLVDDLLLLARLDMVRRPEHQDVDLAQIARAAVTAAHAVEPDRPLTAGTAGSTQQHVLVAGDSDQLRRVVDNLLANIRVHTPPGTPACVLVGTEPDGTVVLEVSDEGPGIPAESLPHVFNRFYRADPARSGDGSGLGLAIVASVVSAHGGQVEVSCAPGRGTTVRVRLPRRQQLPRQHDKLH
ncbi:HAMP domain-containing sensor histidine kinase [Streptomyces sp. NPDC002676]